MCTKQDEAYKAFRRALKPMTPEQLRTVLDEQSLHFGKCIKSLFGVLRSWSQLAAPHLFMVPRASRVDPTFHYYIAPLRLPLCKHLVLDADSPLSIATTLTQAQRLTSITTLELHGSSMRAIASWSLCSMEWRAAPDNPAALALFTRLVPHTSFCKMSAGRTPKDFRPPSALSLGP